MKLLKDAQVAEILNISLEALHDRRSLERGNILIGERQDLVPRWVDVPGRERCQGTPPAEVDAWIERNLVK